MIEVTEKWKYIKGFQEEYMVSNHGNIKSFKNNKEKLLQMTIGGRRSIRLFSKNEKSSISKSSPSVCTWGHASKKGKAIQVAYLVAEYFLHIKVNMKKNVIQFKDNNPLNCHMDNLIVMTRSELLKGKYKEKVFSRKPHKPKFRIKQITKEGETILYSSVASIIEKLNISQSFVYKYLNEDKMTKYGFFMKIPIKNATGAGRK